MTVYKLIAKNTIEEKIQKLQETKKNLADQVIGGGDRTARRHEQGRYTGTAGITVYGLKMEMVEMGT